MITTILIVLLKILFVIWSIAVMFLSFYRYLHLAFSHKKKRNLRVGIFWTLILISFILYQIYG